MNTEILKKEVQDFINQNLNTEVTKIILKESPFKSITSKELANQIAAKKKSEKKLSTWFNTPKIYFPKQISIEQTSSEQTANYKSSLISGDSIIDITGGFGVDCFYFAKHFKNVVHCELNEEISSIVAYNYKLLKVNNIEVKPINGLNYIKEKNTSFDWVYIDPSRRDDTKGKVFLLKDCLPNIPPKLDYLFSKTSNILIKVSPILDITSTIRELKFTKEIHVVAINNEVKELLFLLEKNWTETIRIKTINIKKNENEIFNFIYKETPIFQFSEPLTYLYEPNAAILKSGGFNHLCNNKVFKIAEHSHLFTSNENIKFPGRAFQIIEVLSYDKKKIKKLLPDNKANITTRNFPKTVSQIRKETKIKDGGDIFIFMTTTQNGDYKVLVCKKNVNN
ncbi:MAG: class I SAM-dependent methyltransferase [Flavobacteriaceae bacterium]|nr:class I SAM-dependent methyltransferase [Flavobacteriaceae bacterium]